MLTYVCKEQQEIFTPTARLFPMNFPPKQENTLALADTEVMQLHFKEELDALHAYLDETQFKLDELCADDYIAGGSGVSSKIQNTGSQV